MAKREDESVKVKGSAVVGSKQQLHGNSRTLTSEALWMDV